MRNLQIICLSTWITLIGSQVIESQTYKHIDQFTSNKYFLGVIKGKGIIHDTIINKTGLRITYRFEEGMNSGFTLIRNYDIAPQDYSFMPDLFTLTLKGGNREDQIRLRLWEDINVNGKFDDMDELYASEYVPLGDSVWTTLKFPVTSFKKIAGHGNNRLDLSRIRAWELEVTSQTGDIHSIELFVNDLRFYSKYKPATSDRAALTGTFITITDADSGSNAFWTQQQWNKQLRRMKNMNMNKIIIQYSVQQNKAWYAPCKLSFVHKAETTINKIFDGASSIGIKVYVGLAFSETWYKSDKAAESTYNDLLLNHKETIDELYRLFGANPVFGGWYIPQEVNDYDWQTEQKKTLLFSWLQQVAAYAHQKDASKKVIIAPYFNLWQPADLIEHWYNDFLDIVKDVDWIYPQDGIGTTLKDVHIDIPNYCNHIKKACLKHGKKFGVTVEAFRQLTGWPVDNGVFSATSVDHDQMNEQVQEAYQLKPADIILFEWDYYLHMH